jgi:phosphinothricin acetyltransferase
VSVLTKSDSVHLRLATEADLPALSALYNHYIEAGPVTFDIAPSTVDERRIWLAKFAGGRHLLFVAEEAGKLLGYAGTMPFRPKAAYETTVETTIYLAPDALGRGLGARLYRHLFEALQGEDVHRLLAGITLPNEASVRLHERFGFERVGIFREVGRKQGRYWDVAWYEKAFA